jgi:ubiquinone/menaquinone biosynthesis C-methylase UbiE
MTERVAKGFSDVDAQEEPGRFVAAMDVTSQWPAVRHLRAWERVQLALQPGERLLDVGCGHGAAAMALAGDLQPGGEVVGIDRSDEMLSAGRQAAATADVEGMTFRSGDALALDEPDASFDAARSERTFQWLDDLPKAMAELVRVVRSGGRVVVTDTDWRTFSSDHGDVEAFDAFLGGMQAMRGPSAGAGGMLRRLALDAGLVDVAVEVATHVWDRWDPDTEPAPSGFPPLDVVTAQLVDVGLIDAGLARRYVDGARDAARRDRLFMTVTMVAVAGRKAA